MTQQDKSRAAFESGQNMGNGNAAIASLEEIERTANQALSAYQSAPKQPEVTREELVNLIQSNLNLRIFRVLPDDEYDIACDIAQMLIERKLINVKG